MKDLKKGTLALVTLVFDDMYGYKPTKIRSFAGDPPSKKNNYLFVPAMLTYQGTLTAKDGDMTFFIYFDSKSKAWEATFDPVTVEKVSQGV